MELTHPLDAAVRAKVRAAKPNQAEFAQAIGRSAGWLNKYMQGVGNATLDDVVRMLALLIGVETQPLTDAERRLLKVFRGLKEESREDAISWLRTVQKGQRRERPEESAAPVVQTPRQRERKARGTP